MLVSAIGCRATRIEYLTVFIRLKWLVVVKYDHTSSLNNSFLHDAISIIFLTDVKAKSN